MDAFEKSHIIMILISLILDEVVGNHQFYTQRDGPSLTHDIIRKKHLFSSGSCVYHILTSIVNLDSSVSCFIWKLYVANNLGNELIEA